MITCKYCGQELKFIGEREGNHYFDCTFCEMIFPLSQTSVDRKRKMSVPEDYNPSFYDSTKNLLERDTISLYHNLKDLRSTWYTIKTALQNINALKNDDSLPKPTDLDDENVRQLKREYIDLTKRKFVIENIILERTGFLPPKITNEFLSQMIDLGRNESKKPMFIYIK